MEHNFKVHPNIKIEDVPVKYLMNVHHYEQFTKESLVWEILSYTYQQETEDFIRGKLFKWIKKFMDPELFNREIFNSVFEEMVEEGSIEKVKNKKTYKLINYPSFYES